MKKSKKVFMASVFTVLSMMVMSSLSYGIDVTKQPVIMPKEGLKAPLTDKSVQQGIIIIDTKITKIEGKTLFVNDSKGREISFGVSHVTGIKIGDAITFDEKIIINPQMCSQRVLKVCVIKWGGKTITVNKVTVK